MQFLIDQYLGWSHSGNTHQKYQHYYADDSFDAMLVMDGLVTPNSKNKGKDLLKPRQCPNCSESNKPESKFSSKCRFVLTYDAFAETLEEKEKTKKEFEEMKLEQAELRSLLMMLHESKRKEREWHVQEMKMMKDMSKDDEMLREKSKRH